MGKTPHGTCVDAWLLARSGRQDRGDQLTSLLTSGLRALWDRARPSVGEVILATVIRRAIRSAERRHEALATLGLRVSDRGAFTVAQAPASESDLADAAACVLVETLEALATITADALTPALHAALGSAPVEGSPAHGSLRPPAARHDVAREDAR